MAILKKHTSKGTHYQVNIWDKGNIVKSITFENKIRALKWEIQEKQKIEDRRYFPKKPRNITFSELFQKWAREGDGANLTPTSLASDVQRFRDYLQPKLGESLICELMPEDFNELRGKIRKYGNLRIYELLVKKVKNTKGQNVNNVPVKKISETTINRVFEVAKKLMTYAVKNYYIPLNPTASFKMTRIAEQDFDFWEFEEASKFLTFCNETFQGNLRWKYIFYLMALETGLRLGELLSLTWPKIQLKNHQIRVSSIFDKTLRKVVNRTKGKRIRVVGLGNELLSELSDLKRNSKEQWVFPNKFGNFMDPDNFRNRHFYKDIVKSGVRKIKIHDLRHTFSSHYMMNGGNIYDLQQILGHSDIKLTARYAHLSPDHITRKAGLVNFNISQEKEILTNNIIDLSTQLPSEISIKIKKDKFMKNSKVT